MASVLVLEADLCMLDVLTQSLRFDDHQVHGASTLATGITLLGQQPFDLVVSDLFATTYSLATVLTVVQQLTVAAGSAPVILTTTHAQARDLDPIDHGLSAILLKPFDLDDLFGYVQRAVEQRTRKVVSLLARVEATQKRLQSGQDRAERSSRLLGQQRLQDLPGI
jgi:DNA-binding NtrC family response regulator